MNEKYHSKDFFFREKPLQAKINGPRGCQGGAMTFGFPIKETDEETKMKNIPHSSLPNFHGLSKEDLKHISQYPVQM